MKRLLVLVCIVCVAFVVGCGGGSGGGGGGGDSPSSVARKFYTAVEKGDTKGIEQTATAETAELLAMFGEKIKEGAAEMGKITDTAEVINEDSAVVTVTFDNGKTEDLKLVKVDGKWKVTVDK